MYTLTPLSSPRLTSGSHRWGDPRRIAFASEGYQAEGDEAAARERNGPPRDIAGRGFALGSAERESTPFFTILAPSTVWVTLRLRDHGRGSIPYIHVHNI